MSHYKEKVADIINNAEKYHNVYYSADVFSGPSLYFHKQALEKINNPNFELYLEYIYATLASWGMHRMGKSGSKMQKFHVFKESIESLKDNLNNAREIDYKNVTNENWVLIKEIFFSIKIMLSKTSIVGNSKVMAHLIPNIIAPIDREYTLKYLKGNTTIKNDLSTEWQLMRNIIENFFIPIGKDKIFSNLANKWMFDCIQYPWDTSIFKIIDNLVIGARKYKLAIK